MKFKANPLAAVLVLLAGLGGCASPNKQAVFDDGTIHVQSAFVNNYMLEPDSWSAGTVTAISTDGHDDIAQSVKQTLKAAGYKVPDDGKAQLIYAITELYAGPASAYVANDGAVADTVLGTGLSVLGAIATCAALNSCGSPAVVSNSTANVLTTASVAAANGQGQRVDVDAATNLVVHKVCFAGSCASTAAASSDPAVTVNDLRRVNVEQGIPRTMRLRCTFKQFGPIKQIDQC